MASQLTNARFETMVNLCKLQVPDLQETLKNFKPSLQTSSMSKAVLILEVERLLLVDTNVEQIARYVRTFAERMNQSETSSPSSDIPKFATSTEAPIFKPGQTFKELREANQSSARKVFTPAFTQRPSPMYARKIPTPPSTQPVNIQKRSTQPSISTPFHHQGIRRAPVTPFQQDTPQRTRGLLQANIHQAPVRQIQIDEESQLNDTAGKEKMDEMDVQVSASIKEEKDDETIQVPGETQKVDLQLDAPIKKEKSDEIIQVPGETQQVNALVEEDKMAATDQVPAETQHVTSLLVEDVGQVSAESQKVTTPPVEANVEAVTPRKRKHDNISDDDFDFD